MNLQTERFLEDIVYLDPIKSISLKEMFKLYFFFNANIAMVPPTTKRILLKEFESKFGNEISQGKIIVLKKEATKILGVGCKEMEVNKPDPELVLNA